MFGAKIVARYERILVRTDVVITVRPIMDSAAAIEARFRRQWRPAHVILARAPGDPRGCPFFAGYPDPADATQPDPASVVIGRPTEPFVRHPGPAGIAVNPAALGIRPPVARRLGFARLPNVTVIFRFPPFAVRIQFLVKHSVGRGRTSLRTTSSVSLVRNDVFH